jgi:hypothetical protein
MAYLQQEIPMPLPDDVSQLNEFFGSITLTDPTSQEWEEFDSIPATVGSYAKKAHTHRGPLKVWARKQGIGLSGGLARIRKELRTARHADSPEIAKILLAFLAMSKATHLSPVQRINAIVSATCSAKVSDVLIGAFPPPPDTEPFSIGDFVLGPLERDRLKYWCNKVECDYFQRKPNDFIDRFAIERKQLHTVSVLDLMRIADDVAIPNTEELKNLTDFCFHLLTQYRRESLFEEFVQAQAIAVAMGAPYIVVDQSILFLDSSFISIYREMGQKQKGYFCDVATVPEIDFAQADRRYPCVFEELKTAYGFEGLTSSGVHQTLATFSRFVLQSKVHLDHGRLDEAFLHYVIALDLLFGDKDRSTETVSTRAAMVTHRTLGKSYPEAVKVLKDIYGARSKYVHEGKSVGEDQLERVTPIVNEVVRCLLRLQSQPQSTDAGFIYQWLKKLSYFVAAFDAGKSIDDAEFTAAGIK